MAECHCTQDDDCTEHTDDSMEPIYQQHHSPEDHVFSHSEYPHQDGYLYDCPACEAECYCTRIPGSTEYAECVFCESLDRALEAEIFSSEDDTA